MDQTSVRASIDLIEFSGGLPKASNHVTRVRVRGVILPPSFKENLSPDSVVLVYILDCRFGDDSLLSFIIVVVSVI